MTTLPDPEGVAPRLARHLGPAVLFVALAVLLTWPAVTVLGAAIPGAPTSDAYDHYWGYGWWATSLAQGDLPLRTTVSHWPEGGLLWFVDPLGALLSLPVRALAGPGAAYSIALMLQVWLAMVATYGCSSSSGGRGSEGNGGVAGPAAQRPPAPTTAPSPSPGAAPYLYGTPGARLHADYDLGDKGPGCGRRADAFKLWLLWAGAGDAGLGAAKRRERPPAPTRPPRPRGRKPAARSMRKCKRSPVASTSSRARWLGW